MADASSTTLRAEYRGRLSDIATLGAAVEAFCRAQGVGASVAAKLVFGLEELLTNLVMHGTAPSGGNGESVGTGGADVVRGGVPRVWVVLSREGDHLVAIYEDDGAAFDPLSVLSPDLTQPLTARPVGGLGLHILRSLMDEVTYTRVNERNRVTLRLKL